MAFKGRGLPGKIIPCFIGALRWLVKALKFNPIFIVKRLNGSVLCGVGTKISHYNMSGPSAFRLISLVVDLINSNIGTVGSFKGSLRNNGLSLSCLQLLPNYPELLLSINCLKGCAGRGSFRLFRQNLGLNVHDSNLNVKYGGGDSRNGDTQYRKPDHFPLKRFHGLVNYIWVFWLNSLGGMSCVLAGGLIWERSCLDTWSYRKTGRSLAARFGDSFGGLAAVLLFLAAVSFFYHGFEHCHCI
jgi:hypothetical protein